VSPHQRGPQGQSVSPHRTEIAPISTPTRISEVSASVEQEATASAYNQPAQPIHQVESVTEPLETATQSVLPERLDSPISQPRLNRRAPQLIPSAPDAQFQMERGPVVNSIRAPFAPGQSHLHTTNNLRGPLPVSQPDTAPQEAVLSEPDIPAWRPLPTRQASDGSGNLWPYPAVPEHTPDSYRVDPAAARGHEEQEMYRPRAFLESRDVRGDIGLLVDSLHELFERDRGIASQGDSTHCGVCYLHFYVSELQYREEEGFYVCTSCAHALAHTRITMIRRQQHI